MHNILLVSATKLEHHDEELFGIPIHIIDLNTAIHSEISTRFLKMYNENEEFNIQSIKVTP